MEFVEASLMPFRHNAQLIGYGVVHGQSRRLLGIYATRVEAERRAEAAGEDYEVVFGEQSQDGDSLTSLAAQREASG